MKARNYYSALLIMLAIMLTGMPAHADYDEMHINLRSSHYGIENSSEKVNEIPLGVGLTRWFEYQYIDLAAGAGVFINSHRDPVTYIELSAGKKLNIYQSLWLRPEINWMNHWGYNRNANYRDNLVYPSITISYKNIGLRYLHFVQQNIGVLQINWGLNF